MMVLKFQRSVPSDLGICIMEHLYVVGQSCNVTQLVDAINEVMTIKNLVDKKMVLDAAKELVLLGWVTWLGRETGPLFSLTLTPAGIQAVDTGYMDKDATGTVQ